MHHLMRLRHRLHLYARHRLERVLVHQPLGVQLIHLVEDAVLLVQVMVLL